MTSLPINSDMAVTLSSFLDDDDEEGYYTPIQKNEKIKEELIIPSSSSFSSSSSSSSKHPEIQRPKTENRPFRTSRSSSSKRNKHRRRGNKGTKVSKSRISNQLTTRESSPLTNNSSKRHKNKIDIKDKERTKRKTNSGKRHSKHRRRVSESGIPRNPSIESSVGGVNRGSGSISGELEVDTDTDTSGNLTPGRMEPRGYSLSAISQLDVIDSPFSSSECSLDIVPLDVISPTKKYESGELKGSDEYTGGRLSIRFVRRSRNRQSSTNELSWARTPWRLAISESSPPTTQSITSTPTIPSTLLMNSISYGEYSEDLDNEIAICINMEDVSSSSSSSEEEEEEEEDVEKREGIVKEEKGGKQAVTWYGTRVWNPKCNINEVNTTCGGREHIDSSSIKEGNNSDGNNNGGGRGKELEEGNTTTDKSVFQARRLAYASGKFGGKTKTKSSRILNNSVNAGGGGGGGGGGGDRDLIKKNISIVEDKSKSGTTPTKKKKPPTRLLQSARGTCSLRSGGGVNGSTVAGGDRISSHTTNIVQDEVTGSEGSVFPLSARRMVEGSDGVHPSILWPKAGEWKKAGPKEKLEKLVQNERLLQGEDGTSNMDKEALLEVLSSSSASPTRKSIPVGRNHITKHKNTEKKDKEDIGHPSEDILDKHMKHDDSATIVIDVS